MWVSFIWSQLPGFCYCTSSTRKQLQPFLGFSHFYRRFIHDYSCVAASLTKLTSNISPFTWSPGAGAAFKRLEEIFHLSLSFSIPTQHVSSGWRWTLQTPAWGPSSSTATLQLTSFIPVPSFQTSLPSGNTLWSWQSWAFGSGLGSTRVATPAVGYDEAVSHLDWPL